MANKNTEYTARRKFKQRLVRWGMDQEEINLCLQQYDENRELKANGKIAVTAPLCTRASFIALLDKHHKGPRQGTAHFHLGDDYEVPSDAGYKPTRVDSVLKGTARATGTAAKAVKRGKSFTRFEYNEENDNGCAT